MTIDDDEDDDVKIIEEESDISCRVCDRKDDPALVKHT